LNKHYCNKIYKYNVSQKKKGKEKEKKEKKEKKNRPYEVDCPK